MTHWGYIGNTSLCRAPVKEKARYCSMELCVGFWGYCSGFALLGGIGGVPQCAPYPGERRRKGFRGVAFRMGTLRAVVAT